MMNIMVAGLLQSLNYEQWTNFDLMPTLSTSYAKNVRLNFYNSKYDTTEIRIFKEISETLYNGYYSFFID